MTKSTAGLVQGSAIALDVPVPEMEGRGESTTNVLSHRCDGSYSPMSSQHSIHRTSTRALSRWTDR